MSTSFILQNLFHLFFKKNLEWLNKCREHKRNAVKRPKKQILQFSYHKRYAGHAINRFRLHIYNGLAMRTPDTLHGRTRDKSRLYDDDNAPNSSFGTNGIFAEGRLLTRYGRTREKSLPLVYI
jgi:hypothetical protein